MTRFSFRFPRHTACRFLLSAGLLALLVVSLGVPSARGQSLAQVYRITPKQGAGPELEAALRRHANWRAEQGDPWQWEVYQIVQGESYGTYLLRSSDHTWSDLDEYRQGFGQQAMEHFRETVAPRVASMEAYIAETEASYTRFPQGGDLSGYNLYEVISYRLKPGHEEEFFQAHGKLFRAVTQERKNQYIGTTNVINGAESEYVRVSIPHKSWVDFESPEPPFGEIAREVYGEERAQELLDQYSNSYRSYYSSVAQYRPDLSVGPQE